MAAITYKCPNCGGGLIFDPETQKYGCEYCRSQFSQEELEELSGKENENEDREEEQGEAENAALYTCPSCGAQIVTDETTAATFCYYCHNPVVLSGRLSGEFRPDLVIPFQIDRKKAKEIFEQWVGRKKFVPDGFCSEGNVETMTGVYYPYWMYSCHVSGTLEGQGTSVSQTTMGNTRITTTRIYAVNRSGETDIQGLLRSALKKGDRNLAEGVQPFETEKAREFSMGLLSGFQAEKRDMESNQFSQEAGREVEEFFLDGLKSQGGAYSSFQVTGSQVRRDQEKWSYALLPVWTLTYRHKGSGRIYYFALNGQTGKTCGCLPVDKGKLAILFAAVFFPVLIFMLIVGYFI